MNTNAFKNNNSVDRYPLVSVVTPSYNAMPYLKYTIESVLEQDYPNIEHLVMDGGSKDDTLEILQSYSHLIWVSEKDRGQSHALNKGFARAKGEIIGWLNADDTYTPDAIHEVVKYFANNPDVDLVGSDLNIIDETGTLIGFTAGGKFDVRELLTANKVKQPTVFMRRKVIDQLNGVNEVYHYVMDQEFWLRVGMHGFRFEYLKDKVFANFRLIKGTKTFESSPEFIQEWYQVVIQVLNQSFFKSLPEKDKVQIIKSNRARLYLANMVSAIDKKKRVTMFNNAIHACYQTPRLLMNWGLWKFLFFGLCGYKIDKQKKYQVYGSA